MSNNNVKDFVLLDDVIPDVMLDIRYYSSFNFVGERIDGYRQPIALMTRKAALALKNVSDEMKDKGYRLKIFDCYRPSIAVDHFVRWAKDLDDTRMKKYFYPDVDKDRLFVDGYIAEKSSHSRGSAVDLTLFDMNSGKDLDMGGCFDYFGKLSHPDYKLISDEQYSNRMLLRQVMMKNGFDPYDAEWWHFTLHDEPYPDTYFSFVNSVDSLKNN